MYTMREVVILRMPDSKELLVSRGYSSGELPAKLEGPKPYGCHEMSYAKSSHELNNAGCQHLDSSLVDPGQRTQTQGSFCQFDTS